MVYRKALEHVRCKVRIAGRSQIFIRNLLERSLNDLDASVPESVFFSLVLVTT